MLSASNTNGRTAANAASEIPQSMYQMLLKQVENLTKENSTLKAELINNTSHINKLEGEALRMKDMVLMLGHPVQTEGNLEPDVPTNFNYIRQSEFEDNNCLAGELSNMSLHGQSHPPSHQPSKQQNGIDQEMKQRPEFLLGLSQNSSFNNFSDSFTSNLNEAISPSPSSAVADALKRTLSLFKCERARIVGNLDQEEKIKDHYLKQFKELTSRLDNVSDSDKFTKPNDKTRNEVETEIKNLQKTMDQNLGSKEIMQERLETRLKQIQTIEKEIASVKNHLSKLEMTPISPDSPASARLYLGNNIESGSSLVSHSGTGPDGLWTQTPKLTSPLENMMYEEEFSTCDNSNLDFHIATGKMSRTVQTATSCLAGRSIQNHKSISMESQNSGIPQRDASVINNRNDTKTPGSIESLPSQSDIDDTASMHSFTTSLPRHLQSSSSGPKKDGIHSPSFLHANKEDLYRKFVKMSMTVEGCASMRQNGFVHLIVQIVHDGFMLNLPPCWSSPSTPGELCPIVKNALKVGKDIRTGMLQALRNIATSDSLKSKSEIQILQHLDFIREYCECMFDYWIHVQTLQNNPTHSKDHKNLSSPAVNGFIEKSIGGSVNDGEKNSGKKYDFRSALLNLYDPPMIQINSIRKLSHNVDLRGVINDFGGLFAVAESFILHCRCAATIELVQCFIGNEVVRPDEKILVQLQLWRRFVGFALINLTFGHMSNKTALIQMPGLIDTVMSQLELDCEEMQQVMALFMRNLSWQPDEKCRDILKQKNVVMVLIKCGLKSKREDTLKSVLSALWNLSGHCQENRANICTVKGALGFLVSTLTYRAIAIIESGGGILRNVSSVVATNEEYRQILREKNCLQILLTHLKSTSLTIVSNACGTLWNLSARNAKDQHMLWDLGAVPMLRNLVHSKHSVIAQGSNAALRNLLANRPGSSSTCNAEKNENTKLKVRKQKAMNGHEGGVNGMASENAFSRHAILNGTEKNLTSRSTMNPQRRSLQETTSSSPGPDIERTRRFQKGGIHYSGSLGNLPSSDFNENISKMQSNSKYVSTARNSNSFSEQYSNHRNAVTQNVGQQQHRTGMNPTGFSPIHSGIGMLKDVLMSNDSLVLTNQSPVQKPSTLPMMNSPQTNLSLRQIFQLRAGKTPSSSGLSAPQLPGASQHKSVVNNTGNGMNSSIPYFPSVGPVVAWGNKDAPDLASSAAPTNMQNQVPVQRLQKLIVPKNTEDLARRLHYVEEDYGYDDDTINYSLQYRDEHMTPGIQSPRTEEIYDIASHSTVRNVAQAAVPDLGKVYNMHSQMSGPIIPSASMNGRTPQSDGGLSGLSSCVGSTGSSATRQDKIASRIGPSGMGDTGPTKDRAAQSSILKTMSERYATDRSNMGQSYNLQLNDDLAFEDEKPKNFGAIYSEEQLFEPIQPQSYSTIEQTPYSPSSEKTQDPSSMTQQQTNAGNYMSGIAQQHNMTDSDTTALECQEQEDKFDSGAITPATSFYKSGRNSGMMTPAMYDTTPVIFSRCSSVESVSDGASIHSSRTSEPESRMMSGRVSPSHLPDSPSQSMPVSPRRSPPPQKITVDCNLELPDNPIDARSLEYWNLQEVPNKTSGIENQSQARPTDRAHISNNQFLPSKIEESLRKLEQPGYYSSMPHKDEMHSFHYDGAMSTMTKFSALTINDNDKIQPIPSNKSAVSNVQVPNDSKSSSSSIRPPSTGGGHSEDFKNFNVGLPTNDTRCHSGQRAVFHAGYITSLPTNDEIKKFVNEGTLSPMTAFSEISCLQNDNDGFQKSTCSLFSVPNTRSSATGASVPPPPPDKIQEYAREAEKNSAKGEEQQEEYLKESSNLSSITSPTTHSIDDGDQDFDDDSDSLPSSSSDDEALLQQCIQQGLPKKKNASRGWSSKSSARSTSSKSSSRSGKSSRSKEKVSSTNVVSIGEPTPPQQEEDRSVTNPSPEIVSEKQRPSFNVKQKIAAANMKLKGQPIADYIDNLMKKSEGNDVECDAKYVEHDHVSRTKQVIDNAEMLQQSYSVRKKLREQEKQANKTVQSKFEESQSFDSMPKTTGLLPSEPSAPMQSKMRIQSYLREGITTTYATEGTPIEMSRSTSLSNLTIDSEVADNTDMNTSQIQLKTSYSVPDIQTSTELPVTTATSFHHPASRVPSHNRSSSLGGSDRSSPVVKDSREILEVLGQQIESLSLTTAESVITSKDPGYTTSLPHTDEIRRYEAEGSQFGGTVFSALTIDSDTKIAPTVPADIPEVSDQQQRDTMVNSGMNRNAASQYYISAPQNNASSMGLPVEHMNYVPQTELLYHTNESTRATSLPVHQDQSPWQPQIMQSQFSSHYNNDNDNLAMREERRNYTIEDTPLNMSGPGSLSSLSLDSIDDDNDLLKECINSALPSDKNTVNSPFPNQLQMMQHVALSPGRYNHGVPDGKVDGSNSQQIPFAVPSTRHQLISSQAQPGSQSYSMASYLQSPNDETWSMFQRNADDVATQLIQQGLYYQQFGPNSAAGVPTSTLRSPELQPSSSISLSRPTEGFFNLSRQASVLDSDLSVSSSILGEQHTHDRTKDPYASAPQPRPSRSRQFLEKPAERSVKTDRGTRNGNKASPTKPKDVNAARRAGHLSARTRDSSSGSSSSYRQQQRRRQFTRNNRSSDMCSCQVVCSKPSTQSRSFDHGPVSASTSHLVDNVTSPIRFRRQSTNSASKYSLGHQNKPNRTRNSSKNIYHPSVTQLYPPQKDMDGVLEGVASVAARGDKVFADRNHSQYSSNYGSQALSKKSSSSSLVRSGTFIMEKPSPILIDSMTQREKEQYISKSNSSMSSLSQSQRSSRSTGKGNNRTASPRSNSRNLTVAQSSRISSPRGSTHSLKTNSVVDKNSPKIKTKKKNALTDQPKSKHNKFFSGIKKLLSPSEDAIKSPGNGPTPKKAPSQTGRNVLQTESKNLESKGKNLTPKYVNTQLATTSVKPPVNKKADCSGSSLSLSSSSGSNISLSDMEFEKSSISINKNVTPYGLLPKSPSVNAISRRTISMIPQSHSASVLDQSRTLDSNPTVWRRTPPKLLDTKSKVYYENTTSNSSTIEDFNSKCFDSQSVSSKCQNENKGIVSKTGDVWVSKKDASALLEADSYYHFHASKATQNTDAILYNDCGYNESMDEATKRAGGNALAAGFQSPPRTQSPRVVQQVAPFNYKPSPSKLSEHHYQHSEKSVPVRQKITRDCKHTPV